MTKTLRFHPKLNLMHSIKLCSIFCLCSFDFWGFCKDLTKMKLGWSQMLECCMFKLNQTNLSKQIHFWVQFKDMNTISLTVKLLVSGCLIWTFNIKLTKEMVTVDSNEFKNNNKKTLTPRNNNNLSQMLLPNTPLQVCDFSFSMV